MENTTRNLVALTWTGEGKFHFTSNRQDIQFTYQVSAENGETKRGRGFADIKAARAAMRAQLKAYDKKQLGAWGEVLKVEAA